MNVPFYGGGDLLDCAIFMGGSVCVFGFAGARIVTSVNDPGAHTALYASFIATRGLMGSANSVVIMVEPTVLITTLGFLVVRM